jgi:hypothetical protein
VQQMPGRNAYLDGLLDVLITSSDSPFPRIS